MLERLEVDPTDPNRVFAGGIDLWMSTDGGVVKWENITLSKDPSYPLKAHGDFHALAFDPANPKMVYVGNDGGIDRADLSQPLWHWDDVAHGMIITQFWNMTSNRAYPTLIAGGTQDNGIAITFGNRTWYQVAGGDGYDVGSDAGNPDTLYADDNHDLSEFANPVPGTADFQDKVPWSTLVPLHPPAVTDVVVPGGALARGGDSCNQQFVMKTVDGKVWDKTNATLPPGGSVVALASAPTGDFKTYLAAVAYKAAACPNAPPSFTAFVIRTVDGGATWTQASGLPAKVPSSVAFNHDGSRSYVTYQNGGGIVYMSIGGGPYSNIGNGLPFSGVWRMAADPFDVNVLYAGTSVGIFRGVVDPSTTPPTATWAPFDEGLPDGMEVDELWADPKTGILTIGSWGYGAFRRDIRKDAKCAARMLVVRDTVYDDGREPSASEIPDAEHPLTQYPFYKPDDTIGGWTAWWKSHDIRIDVPSNDPPANKIDDADSVEFEICPITAASCPPDSMRDSAPQASKDARVYVQVTNRGVEQVKGTRVIALWSKAGAAFGKLPDTFWTKTFPAYGDCGPLDLTTGWRLVDPDKPCRTIDTVTPEMPELARFDWSVPDEADGGATMFTVVESPLDPLDPSIRDQNKLTPSEIVPGSRHIALRSVLHIDYDVRVPFLWPLDLLHLPGEMSEVEVVVSKPDLRESVRIVLPPGLTARAGFGNVRQTRVTEDELVPKLQSMRLDPSNAWELNGDEASLFVDLQPGQRVTTGVIAAPASLSATSQVSIVERSRGKAVGGSVMLLRPKR